MNENLKTSNVVGNIAYKTPEIKVYEIGIENSILSLSGGTPPEFGFGGEWI